MKSTSSNNILEQVRERYGNAAKVAATGKESSCCSPECCGDNPVTSDLYTATETAELPETAVKASLGCGNPTALAELHEGETVLDLGSGGGIDVLLSARRVGPTGFAYGLDTTDEMLEVARRNKAEAGVENVSFLKGVIEDIPLPDDNVDVIISNCVINLSADKPKVLAEAFRVLKPGGRFAVSDIVARGQVPESVRSDMELYLGCIAGSLEETEYRRLLAEVGFGEIEVVPTRIYDEDHAKALFGDEAKAKGVGGLFMSAFVRARKPLAS